MNDLSKIIEAIQAGAVGILPTDTIYGIVASINFPESIRRIYETKARDPLKRMVHLIGNESQLTDLGVELNAAQIASLATLWPGPVSIIFPTNLHDEVNYPSFSTTIAVRLPKLDWLQELVKQTGPIVATSANISGEPHLGTMSEIKAAFPNIDFYIEGSVGASPSQLAKIDQNGTIEWIERT